MFRDFSNEKYLWYFIYVNGYFHIFGGGEGGCLNLKGTLDINILEPTGYVMHQQFNI